MEPVVVVVEAVVVASEVAAVVVVEKVVESELDAAAGECYQSEECWAPGCCCY